MIDGFVLAGGRSVRMGADKARVEVDGVALAVRVALALDAVCGRVRLVRRVPGGFVRPDGTVIDVVLEDASLPTHPLWGLATACRHATTSTVLVAPCDLPDLRPEHLRGLASANPPAVAFDGERVHPLLGIWPVSVGEAAARAAAAGTSAVAFAREAARVVLPVDALRNVNAPVDLRRDPPGSR